LPPGSSNIFNFLIIFAGISQYNKRRIFILINSNCEFIFLEKQYQTDGSQGFYYNTSITSTPAWVFIGSGSGTVTSITASASLSGGTITSSGTVALANG